MNEIIISLFKEQPKNQQSKQQQANQMVKTIVSAVSSEREVERMVQERAMSEGEPVRMRWGGRVCTATPGGRFTWEEDRVASSQVVIGDEACRGLVIVLTSGAFHYPRTVGFAMGEDVVQTLHNPSDESVGGFDLKRCQMGTVSVQHPSFFDFGGRVMYVNASPTVAGQDAYVHFSHKSNGVLTHSGDQSSGTGREQRLGHFITTTGTVTEPVAFVFTSYAQSTLSQFGVAIFFVYDKAREEVHFFPLYNRVEEVGERTTVQHGFTMVPERDASGRLKGTHTLHVHRPEGRVGERYPALKKGCSDDDWVRERVLMAMVAQSEREMAQREREREEAAAVAAAVAAVPTVVEPPSPPSVAGPPAAGVRSHVLADAAQTGFLARYGMDGVASTQVVGRTLGTDVGPLHPVSLLLGLGNPGQVFPANGRCAEEPSVQGHSKTVVMAVGDFRDDHRGDWLGWGYRMTNGVLVMVPSEEMQQAYATTRRSKDAAVAIEELMGRLGPTKGLNPVVLLGGGSLMAVEVILPSGAKALLRMFGSLPGSEDSPPETGADVTEFVKGFVKGEMDVPLTSLVEGMAGMSLVVDKVRMIPMVMAKRLPTLWTECVRGDKEGAQRVKTYLHRLAGVTELLSGEEKQRVEAAVVDSATSEWMALKAEQKALWESFGGDREAFATSDAFRQLSQRMRLARPEVTRRQTLVNRHFVKRMRSGASVGRVNRRTAQQARTAELTGVLERGDVEEYASRMVDEEAVVMSMRLVPAGCQTVARLGEEANLDALVHTEGHAVYGEDNRGFPFQATEDEELATTLMEVTHGQPHWLSTGSELSTAVPTMDGETEMQVVLPGYLEEGVTVESFDFSPAALAVTNEKAAFYRQAMRAMVCRLGGRERGALPPSHPSVGWMLVMVYLTAVERTMHRQPSHERDVPSVVATDLLPTVRRRLVIALSHVLGAGQTQMSGLASFFSSKRSNLFPLAEYEWHVLGRLVRVLPGCGWSATEVAERHKAFVMRYLHARVLRPVAKGWEGAEKKDLAAKEADNQREVERQRSEAYQERKVVALYRRWVGEAVSTSEQAFLVDGFLSRKKDGLFYALVTKPETVSGRSWSGLRRCVGKVGERGAEEVTVRDAVAFHLTFALAKELRDVVCSCCKPEQRAVLRAPHMAKVLGRFIGAKAMKRVWEADEGAAPTEEECADASVPPDTALMSRAGELVGVLRGWGFPCRHWYGDWEESPPRTSEGEGECCEEVKEVRKEVWTVDKVLTRCLYGGACPEATQVVETLLESSAPSPPSPPSSATATATTTATATATTAASGSGTVASWTSVLQGRPESLAHRGLCKQLSLKSDDWDRVLSTVGWTEARVGRAMRVGLMKMVVDGVGGGELEKEMMGVE